MRERLALNIMLLVGQTFRDAKADITMADIGTRLGIPVITLEPLVTGLERSGLLASTDNDELIPGRDLAGIELREIVAVVRNVGETGSIGKPQWSAAVKEIGARLDRAVTDTVEGTTLAEFLDSTKSEPQN